MWVLSETKQLYIYICKEQSQSMENWEKTYTPSWPLSTLKQTQHFTCMWKKKKTNIIKIVSQSQLSSSSAFQ